jgi:hypothetical protein
MTVFIQQKCRQSETILHCWKSYKVNTDVFLSIPLKPKKDLHMPTCSAWVTDRSKKYLKKNGSTWYTHLRAEIIPTCWGEEKKLYARRPFFSMLVINSSESSCQVGSAQNLFRLETKKRLSNRVARFFLIQRYQNGKNIPKWPHTIPNDNKLYQMALICIFQTVIK